MKEKTAHPDSILRGTLAGGQAGFALARTTRLAEEARRIHQLSPLAAAALGRTLSMTAIMTLFLKGENESITVTLDGKGLIGKIVAIGRPGALVKGYVGDPQLELPLNENGKLDVAWAVGRDGMLTVVRDLGMREPYVGQTRLQTGEIGEDFAFYFTVSEQTPSMVAVGVLVGQEVLSSGGLLVQALPECSEEVLSALEDKAGDLSDISSLFAQDQPIEAILEELLGDLQPQILERARPMYECDCSRGRIIRALIAMGEEEMRQMIREQDGAEVSCYFCNKVRRFTGEELENILEEAKR
ncbi:MAG: Hsp33 family molecular chaperone HslO [Christensenellales bacterium]